MYPRIAANMSGGIVVAWTDQNPAYNVWARILDVSGIPVSPEFQVNSYISGNISLTSVGMSPDGSIVVAMAADMLDGTWWNVYARWFDASGIPLGPEQEANEYLHGIQGSSSLAVCGNGFSIVAWTSLNQIDSSSEVFAQRFDAQGNALGAGP